MVCAEFDVRASSSFTRSFRYVGQGCVDRAREILVEYHGNGDPGSPIVALEMEEMLEVISVEGSDKRWWDVRDLFNSRGARYRTFIIACMAFFGQWDLPPTSYYFPLMGKWRRSSPLLCTPLIYGQQRRQELLASAPSFSSTRCKPPS